MKPVIVIGMHRSGTSLIVKVLEKLGVFMGADQEHNGESLFFNTINEWILNQSHIRWDNPENYKYFSTKAKETLIPIIKNRMKSYHKKEYFGTNRKQNSFSNNNFPWGWKDPRNTFTIDIWKEVFTDLKIVHIHRNPIDVINSLCKREESIKTNIGNPTRTGIRKKLFGMNLPQSNLFLQSFRCLDYTGGFSLWKEYTAKALSIRVDEPSKIFHFSYEKLLTAPSEIISDLTEFLNIENKKIDHKFIDSERKFAFIHNPESVKFYQRIKTDELVTELGYGNID